MAEAARTPRRTSPRWRLGLLALALGLPFAATALGARAAIAPLAGLAAGPLSQAAFGIADSLPEPRLVVPLTPTPEAEAIAAIDGLSPAADADAPGAAGPITHSGIGVSRARVMAAVKAGIRPSGSGVPATAWRPAGLALHGISAVGIGLRDGDVLTRVGGSPASSPAAVISAVRTALRLEHPAIVGEVWRGRHRFLVSVELPRVKFRDEDAAAGEQLVAEDLHHGDTEARRASCAARPRRNEIQAQGREADMSPSVPPCLRGEKAALRDGH